MNTGILFLDGLYQKFFLIILVILGLMLFGCLLRAVLGPRVSDRLMAINMMGTIVMVMICMLALKMQEGYLVDIAIIYALLSFLAVVIFARVYVGVYEEKQNRQEGK